MAEVNVDKLIRSLSRLQALSSSVSDSSVKEQGGITLAHVQQYHEVLKGITSNGIDVTEFQIPGRDINTAAMTGEKWVLKSVFLMQLNGIINYLEALLKDPQEQMGFKPRE